MSYIYLDPNKMIFLTEKGTQKALEIHERHEVLTQFLEEVLHVDATTAEEDACHMEHVISDATFQGLKRLLDEKRAK